MSSATDLFADSAESVGHALEQHGLPYDIERKLVRKHGESRTYTHIHVPAEFQFELTVYAADEAHYVFKSSITGKAIERASIAPARLTSCCCPPTPRSSGSA